MMSAYSGKASPPANVTHSSKKILITAFVSASWMTALALGARALLHYETTPGSAGTVGNKWPAASTIQRAGDKPTLVMLAHPHCPCSAASVAELAEIMAHSAGRVNAYVLFLKPAGAGEDWDDTALRRTAANIPGVKVLTDDGGTEAARFGAETSGHTLVFDEKGTLLFSGGITASRGHIGTNPGSDAALAAAKGETIARDHTPVFGCSFTGRNQKSQETK
jgi:glyoxylase-like metal-dependent hydrolase (beta-lactamase superfamily II)